MLKEVVRNEVVPEEAFARKETLSNGLRVLTYEMPWAHSVTARLHISAGSRWDDEDQGGIAHYLEHMIYEGSQKYPSRRDLDKAIEGMGGENDGSTYKEDVKYQAKVPKEHAAFATEFLREMVFNPLFADEAVAREKGVIVQELKRNNDDQQNNAIELLGRFAWAGHPLASHTLGTFKSIKAITKGDLIKFHQEFYRPNNSILVMTGALSHGEMLALARNNFGDLEANPELRLDRKPPVFASRKSRVSIENKNFEEAQILLGFSTEGRGEDGPDTKKLEILANLISLNIFHKLIYDLGISYSASAYPWLFSDGGIIVVNAGVSPKDAGKAVDVIVSEINNLAITPQLISESKEGLKSSLTLHLADTDDYANFIGEQEFYRGHVHSPREIRRQIDSVGQKEIEVLKSEIISRRNSVLVISGPVNTSQVGVFEAKLKKLK